MDPAAPSAARGLLREFGLHPRKRRGQHFLTDGNVLDRIARLALPHPDQPSIEIGAGLGALTLRLAERTSRLAAVEIDLAFRPVLERIVGQCTHVTLVFEDFLNLDLSRLLKDTFGDRKGVVVGNIPYNITSPILERLLGYMEMIERIVLLIQSEVAMRLIAEPNSQDYSSLTVFAQYHTRVRHHGSVSAHLFYPPPEVGSAIVAMEPHSEPPVRPRSPECYRAVVRAAFGYRRKTIANALAAAGIVSDTAAGASILASTGIDPRRRGESLTLVEFGRLSDAVYAWGSVR